MRGAWTPAALMLGACNMLASLMFGAWGRFLAAFTPRAYSRLGRLMLGSRRRLAGLMLQGGCNRLLALWDPGWGRLLALRFPSRSSLVTLMF